MSSPVRFTYTLATADADGIAVAQAVAGAGNLTLNGALVSGGIANLVAPRRVIITSAGNDSGITFTVYGLNAPGGNPISETVAGANVGVATTTKDFYTVTRIAASGAAAGNVEAGTSGVGASPWRNVNYEIVPVNLSVAVVVVGTVNYTIQYTYDQYWAPPFEFDPIKVWDDPAGAQAASYDTSFDLPITGWRVQINSGTGSLQVTGIQAGIAVT